MAYDALRPPPGLVDNGEHLGYPVAVDDHDPAAVRSNDPICNTTVWGIMNGRPIDWVCTLPQGHGRRWHVAHGAGIVLAINIIHDPAQEVNDGL